MKTILPFLPVIFVSLIACTLQAQQLPLFSQYREYQGLINPGSVTNDYLTIGHTKAVGLSHRRQWKDIPNGISTQLARFEWFDPGTRLDQARLVPRAAGLHLACGFGARGITLAPLLGDLVAARIAGTPLPLPQSLVDLVDPSRWIVRAARHSGRAVP